MGQRTKGNMWCKRDGPVLGVKNTHRVRNTSALVGSLAIPGAFLFGKVEGYYCPKCGERVRPAWMGSRRDAGASDVTSEVEKDEAYWAEYVSRVTEGKSERWMRTHVKRPATPAD